MKKINILFIALIAITIFLTGCADVEQIKECTIGHTYGFWGGAWHGTITIVSFIGSLFSDDISIYAVNNNGTWYDFGFIIGLGGAIKFILAGINIVLHIIFGK